jgi:thiamine pyrophosphate-dependent acetolactate synthase large subunit-like protein
MMCNWRDRGIQNATIGTTLTNPDLNYAKIAQGMGLYAEGPITDPNDLAPAIRRAVEVVKRGEPALLDVHTQGR